MRLVKKLPLLLGAIVMVIFGYGLLPWNPLLGDARADKIVVVKSTRTLALYRGSTLLKTYRIALGSNPVGDKQYEGDGRTPEGSYRIASRNGESCCHLGLKTSYPSGKDVKAAKTEGKAPGGDIMIHGLLNGLGWIGRWHRWVDWTAGCMAVTDAEMEEIYRAVPNGTPIEIKP